MTNNDILRRLRYTFELSDSTMMSLASTGDEKINRSQISDWLKKDNDPDFKPCNDKQLAIFLNHFIDKKRGKKEGDPRKPEKRLTNNIIFTKLKIALNLKADDVIEVLSLANFQISKAELSAFFRKVGHKHYRECKDQILRNFLQGLQLKYRADGVDSIDDVAEPSIESTKPTQSHSPEEKTPQESGFQWKVKK